MQPWGVVTTTARGPAMPGGVVQTIWMGVLEMMAAGVPPMVTLHPAGNPLPKRNRVVPPAAAPEPGVTVLMAGALKLRVANWPSGLVTTNGAGHGTPTGTVVTICVALCVVIAPGTPPKVTEAALEKFAPVMVTVAPTLA